MTCPDRTASVRRPATRHPLTFALTALSPAIYTFSWFVAEAASGAALALLLTLLSLLCFILKVNGIVSFFAVRLSTNPYPLTSNFHPNFFTFAFRSSCCCGSTFARRLDSFSLSQQFFKSLLLPAQWYHLFLFLDDVVQGILRRTRRRT